MYTYIYIYIYIYRPGGVHVVGLKEMNIIDLQRLSIADLQDCTLQTFKTECYRPAQIEHHRRPNGPWRCHGNGTHRHGSAIAPP